MGTVFPHRSPSLFLSPGLSGNQAPSLKGLALHHARSPIPSRVDDGWSITVRARSHHDGGSLTPEDAAINSARYNQPRGHAEGAWLASCSCRRWESAVVLVMVSDEENAIAER